MKPIILIILSIFCAISYSKNLNATQNNKINESQILKYEILKIDELSKNRLKIIVLIKETPTLPRLKKLSNHLVNVYNKENTHGIYLIFTHHPDAIMSYGNAEYGPNGSAGYSEKNLNQEKFLNTENLKIPSNEEIHSINKSIENTKTKKVKKETLKQHILSTILPFHADKDTLLISTFEDGYEVAFSVPTNELNLEPLGIKIIKNILNSNPPATIIGIEISLVNKYQILGVVYNGKAFYKIENGETTEIVE